MASWKKVVVSGSNAQLGGLFVSGNITNKSTVSGTKVTGSFTGSFKGAFSGDGSGLTGLPSGAVSSYTNAGDNRVITSVSAGVINGETNLTFDGSVLIVTGRANITTALTASTIQATGLPAGTTDTVIVRTAGNNLATRTINKNAWSTGTIVTGSGTATQVAYWGPGNSLTSDAGMTYNAGTDVLTVGTSTFGQNTAVAGTLAVNGATLSTDDTTFNLINTTATTVNFAGASTTVNIGAATGITNVKNSLTVDGDLRVSGTTTTVNSTNLTIADKFALFASGSDASTDGGIIVQQGTTTGYALGVDASVDRWALQNNAAPTATTIAPDAFMGVIQEGAASPSAVPVYGGGAGLGTIFVNNVNGEIWIFS